MTIVPAPHMPGIKRYHQPHKPLLGLEFWRQGQQMENNAGLRASLEYLLAERFGSAVDINAYLKMLDANAM